MKTRNLLAFPAASILLLAIMVSCGRGETVITTFEQTYEQKLEQSDSAGVTVSHSIEYLESIEGGKSLCAKVNRLIAGFCFPDVLDATDIAQASEESAQLLVEDYRKDAVDSFDDEDESYWAYNWSYMVSGRFAESYGDFQTYSVYSENYLGGPHAMQSMIPHIINLKSGEEVLEEDIFVEGYEEPVAGLIRDALQREWGDADDPSSTYCMMEEEGMVPNGFIGVDEEGVTWYYQPYVIASYAQGVIEAKVPWSELKPYLSKSFLKN